MTQNDIMSITKDPPSGSFFEKMAASNAVKRARRSARVLFSAPKHNVTFENHRDRYYKQVFIDRQLWEAVDFLARVNHTSRMRVANDMMRLGIGHYFGAKIAEQNRLAASQREAGQPLRPTYFAAMLRHWAKQKGYDIGKFV